MRELWRNALRQFHRFWLSAAFLVLGSACGVAAVVFTLGNALDQSFRTIHLQPADTDRTLALALRGEVSAAELHATLRGLPDLAAVVLDQPFRAGPEGREGLVTSMEVTASVWHPPMMEGRFLDARDGSPDAEPAVVIGKELAQSWFPAQEAVGRTISLQLGARAVVFQVIGVMGVAGRLSAWDQQIIIPGRYDPTPAVSRFQIKATASAALPALRQAVEQAVKQRLRGAELHQAILAAAPPDQTEQQALLALSGLSLLIVAVTAVNTGNLAAFWAHRRRREIGIRQALGATRSAVVGMVLAEVLILNLAGALLGLTLYGMAVVRWGDRLPLHFQSSHVGAGLVVALLGGLMAGAVPAFLVARMDPAEAIRTE